MKGLFIPGITAEMFKNECLESIGELMAEGKIYNIEYSGWTPVSERYPTDINKDYLVCYEDGCITIEHLYFNDYDGDPFFSEMELGVVAWMPLPKPYMASPAGAESEEV